MARTHTPRMLTYPTGLTVYPIGSGAMSLVWFGPGTRLHLGIRVTEPGGSFGGPIEHPTANGTYATRAEASRAVAAFIAAGDES